MNQESSSHILVYDIGIKKYESGLNDLAIGFKIFSDMTHSDFAVTFFIKPSYPEDLTFALIDDHFDPCVRTTQGFKTVSGNPFYFPIAYEPIDELYVREEGTIYGLSPNTYYFAFCQVEIDKDFEIISNLEVRKFNLNNLDKSLR